MSSMDALDEVLTKPTEKSEAPKPAPVKRENANFLAFPCKTADGKEYKEIGDLVGDKKAILVVNVASK